MTKLKRNLLKGQSEDVYEMWEKHLRSKYGIPSICSNNRIPAPHMPVCQPDPSTHDRAHEFFAHLRKTCRTSEPEEK